MPTLEDRTLKLLDEAIARDRGQPGAAGDLWLERMLGTEILESVDLAEPIKALERANAPALDPQEIGRRAGRRLEVQVGDILHRRPGEDSPGERFLELPGADVCSMTIAALTIGLGVGADAACTAAALILRHLPDPTLETGRPGAPAGACGSRSPHGT